VNLNQLNRILSQALFLPVIALLLLAGVLVWQIFNAWTTVNRIETVDQNIATINLISAMIADEQAGVSNYQNTPRQAFLQPYLSAIEPLKDNMQKLHDGVESQGGDVHTVDLLMMAHHVWVSSVAIPAIDAAREHRPLASPLNRNDEATMDTIRRLESGILSSQQVARSSLADHWQQDLLRTLGVAVGLTVITGLLIGIFTYSRLHMVSSAFEDTLEALRRNAHSTYESEQRLRATLTSIGESVVVCDVDGRIELLNTAAQQLSGWTQTEAFHQELREVFPLDDEITHRPLIAPFATASHIQQSAGASSTAVLQRDGAVIFVEYSGAPIFDHSGELTGSVIVFRDVTGQRRTQAALLASEKLAVAGRLAASIAHEIHNPLDSVVNLLYLMKQDPSPEERAEFIDLAQGELARVTQISRAMLGMHRESRTPVMLDISAILRSVMVLLERSMTEHGVTVRTKLASNAVATGYPAELRQVFTNILTNAAQASMPGSRIEVTVRTRSPRRARGDMPASPSGVTIAIADQGHGIPPKVLSDLFQPFITTKGERGTGLGLWISKGIIEKHGGTIQVDSRTDTSDHGTTFTIFLPRGEAVSASLAEHSPADEIVNDSEAATAAEPDTESAKDPAVTI
jgi:PAS domain S-box-containing protein